jgi:hypothetical protein
VNILDIFANPVAPPRRVSRDSHDAQLLKLSGFGPR